MLAAAKVPMRPGNSASHGKPPSSDGSSEAAILVAVRVRPFSSKEQSMLPKQMNSQFGLTARNFMNYTEPSDTPQNTPTLRKVVHTIDDHVLVFDPPDENDGDRRAPVGASNKRHKDIRFVFDRVYGEESTQRDLYEGTTRGLLDSVMSGYNATVFAYGATGCGKTYTITGCPEDPGVIFLTMQELFERVNAAEDEKAIEVSLSYLEVYNETIRDLLVDDPAQAVPLALREDARQGVTVAGLSEHVPHGVDEVMGLMLRGNENRTMSPTEANAVSSRSHAVLQVHVRQKPKAGGLQTDVTTATLSIIDLAGSERATVARNNGTRMREGANINRSLLALANCINALCDQKTKRHIPYRDSKLTRLLKFSLGGNCRTVMITCVSPASTYYEETHNTLKYANRAKNIKTTVAKNTKSTQVHLAQYQGKIREQSDEIKRLQREIASLKSRPSAGAAAGANSRSSAQAAQAMAELRKQTQAIQVVQDMRNKMAAAYAPIREAKWEHASALTVGEWYDHHADALKGWREQFETAFQEQQHLFGGSGSDMDIDSDSVDGSSVLAKRSLVFRQQVDELLRDLTRERKTIGRHAEHSAQLIERNSYMADRAAQVPPSVQLTAEQRYHVDQEHRVLSLSAERGGLRRQVELGEHIASSLASQNTLLLRLTATCLCNLKRAAYDAQGAGPHSAGIARVLEQVYMQAISSFSEVTGAVRDSMKQVRDAGGPSKLAVNGSTLTPPSPYVPARNGTNGVAVGARAQSRSPNEVSDRARPAPRGAHSQANGTAAGSTRNANVAAISAAVAGTTRARRAAASAQSNGGSSSTVPPPGRHMRSSPPKRSQAVLGRTAVRINGTSTGEGSNGVRQRTAARAAHSTTSSSRGAAAATGRVPLRNGNSRHVPPAAAAATEAERNLVAAVSPPVRKATSFAVGDSLSATLPSPTTSTQSVSPVSSVGSWASAETSPHHEPLPAAARPLKGILKQSSSTATELTRANSGGSPDDGKPVPSAGPIRLGSVRRKSRQARIMANPTNRSSGTPTKPTNGTSRELFKSVAQTQPKRVPRR
ncbi:tubulin-dependent ATPase kip3 [Coemansia guatemalensis]|uniref:Tubulin-dependent ATPase kip3 n=1 Tax=Coemansia guatemalensis TaxID=2761395 RepID=A0A9W8LRF5_9FUNG|nr:tubulin-dependent ATPase kip3 [Coemansia guatemalensis]